MIWRCKRRESPSIQSATPAASVLNAGRRSIPTIRLTLPATIEEGVLCTPPLPPNAGRLVGHSPTFMVRPKCKASGWLTTSGSEGGRSTPYTVVVSHRAIEAPRFEKNLGHPSQPTGAQPRYHHEVGALECAGLSCGRVRASGGGVVVGPR